MIELQNYFQQQTNVKTVDSCLELPQSIPTLIKVDYDRIAVSVRRLKDWGRSTKLSGTFNELLERDNQGFLPRHYGFEDAQPLISFTLSKMDEAGVDLERLKYAYEIASSFVIPCFNDVHIDGHIDLTTFEEDMLRTTGFTRTLLSDHYVTAVLPNKAIFDRCPPEQDRNLFFAGVHTNLKWEVGFEDQVRRSGILAGDSVAQRKFVHQIMPIVNDLERAHSEFVKPDPSHAVTFNESIVHMSTCVAAFPTTPNAVLRNRIIFDSYPNG